MTYRHTKDSQLNQIQYELSRKVANLEQQQGRTRPNTVSVTVSTSPVSVTVPEGTIGAAVISSSDLVTVQVRMQGTALHVVASGTSDVVLALF